MLRKSILSFAICLVLSVSATAQMSGVLGSGIYGGGNANMKGNLLYMPLDYSLDFTRGQGSATFAGGDNGTIIDCDGLVQSIPADTPRFFGARYSAGTYYGTTSAGVAIPTCVDEVYPIGGAAIGDSQTDNTYSYSVVLTRKLGVAVDNFGVGGNTLQSIYTNLVTNGLAKEYDWYVVQGGVNNLGGAESDPNTSMQAALIQIADAIVANGSTPIFLGVSPWENAAAWTADRQTWTDTYNAWLESYCTTNGYFFVDLYELFEDPADADAMHADYDSGDGLHWNVAADLAIGEVLYYHLAPNFFRGLLIEKAVQNLAIYSEDASNAAWVKTNITRAEQTATAPDGAAVVDKITADAANGTMLQTVTAAEGNYSFSCWLKRLTGTGWIDLTTDNGTTWTRKYVVDSWQRFDVTKSTTNPVFGIRIQTSGDAVLFWGGQLNTGKYPKSYVPTTTAAVTKAAETLKIPTSGNVDNDNGTMIVQAQKQGSYLEIDVANEMAVWASSTLYALAMSGTGSTKIYAFRYGASANHGVDWGISDETDRLTSIRLASTWDSTGLAGVFRGDATRTGYTHDGIAEAAYNAPGDYLWIGSSNAGTYQIDWFFQGVWIYNHAMSATRIASVFEW